MQSYKKIKYIKQMRSILINSMESDQDFIEVTKRIYIDPQELIALKKKRKSFKMVKSIYEPSEENSLSENKNLQDQKTHWSSKQSNRFRNLSSPKFNTKGSSRLDRIISNQNTQSLQQLIQNQQPLPNVQFIWKIIPSSIKKQIISYQQGDCIPFDSSKNKQTDKYLLLSGQIKVIGKNGNGFRRKAGFIYFQSNQTKEKIKEIVVLKSSKVLKINPQIYEGVVKPYIRLKYMERVHFLHFCPFSIWNDKLSEDLAACMELIMSEKQEVIYNWSQHADKIYFVKQGIVLLERNKPLRNSLIEGYEQHYEKNEITDKDVILVVRKGMVFGVDGIIIKEFYTQSLPVNKLQIKQDYIEKSDQMHQNNQQNEELQSKQFHKSIQTNQRSNNRVYTARTLGKCELYSFDKKVLETLFTMNDISEDFLMNKKRHSFQQLQRLSLEYTAMLSKNIQTGVSKMPLKKKQIVLQVENNLSNHAKSLSSLQLKPSMSLKNNKKLNISPSKFFVNKNKSTQNNQQLQQINEQKQIQKYYLNQEKQITQLKNRVQSQREKSKQLLIKKQNKSKSPSKNQVDPLINQTYFPKIFLKKQAKSFSNQKNTKNQKLIKLDSIINKKLQQDIKSFNTQSSNLQKIENNQKIREKKRQSSQLIKFLEEQNIQNKSNPSFINVKSYKSISSVVSSLLKP